MQINQIEWDAMRRDRRALEDIHELLDGTEWNVGDLESIADIIRFSGRVIREPNEGEQDE